MVRRRKRLFAAIHVGSELVSMQIVEFSGLDKVKVLEQAEQRVRLGEETFKNKRISFAMVVEICDILKGFRQLMRDYGVEDYAAQATTAVREADNQMFFVDQIYVKTGIKVEIVDMPREIFTKFAAILRTLNKYNPEAMAKGVLFVDISSGGLGITCTHGGKVVYQHNLHLGVIRLKEDFDRNQRSHSGFGKVLTEYVCSQVEPVREALAAQKIKYFVLSGTEVGLMLRMLGRKGSDKKVQSLHPEDFQQLYTKVRRMNLNQIVQTFQLEQESAELIWPTIILYQQLLSLVAAKDIYVMPEAFIDGIKTIHIAEASDPDYLQYLRQIILSAVEAIGMRYGYDKQHTQQVEKISMALFTPLAKSFGLSERDRMLVRAACMLHDIGKVVNLRTHATYSYHLIRSTDILGISARDREIIALTSYYHANPLFERQAAGAPQVEREIVPHVAKLAAIVRLADAMDRSYTQKIESVRAEIRGKAFHIVAQSKEDLTLEEWIFAHKASFFEEVYGLEPVLERENG